MSNIQRIKKAVDRPQADAMSEDDWDELIAEEVERQAAATGADPAEIAWLLAGSLAEHRKTIQAAEAAIRRWRAGDIADRGPVRYGDTFSRVKPKTTREIMDRAALLGWLEHTARRLGGDEDAADLIDKVWRLDAKNLRITTLRALAERVWKHEHPDGSDEDAERYAWTITDTFISEDRAEDATLEDLPISKAPKYAAALGHGHRVGAFDNKEQEDPQ